MYKKTELSNGLKVVTHDIKDRDSISLGFFVGVGGRYETDRIKGAAHFLEHMVFKGSQHYTCEQIKESIEGIGGTLNAFTSEEQTCYYAKIPSKHLSKTFDVLSDMVFHPKVNPRDLTKEKTVIMEEIKMYRDLPQHFVLELMDALMWPSHPLGKNLAGSMKSVNQMRSKDLLDFHGHHYLPGNVVVSACGNLKDKDMFGLIKKKLNHLKGQRKSDFIRFQNKQEAPAFHFFQKKIEQVHLAMGFHGFHETHEDRYILSLLSVILGGNMSSRLFVELREKKGLAYSISSTSKSLNDTGIFMIRAGFDAQKIVEATGLIIKELSRIKRLGVSHNEFSRAKEYLLGQILLGLEDTMEHMLWLGDNIVTKNKVLTLKDFVKIFEKIRKEDIQRVAKKILDGRFCNLALVGPVKEKEQEQLRQLIDAKR